MTHANQIKATILCAQGAKPNPEISSLCDGNVMLATNWSSPGPYLKVFWKNKLNLVNKTK